MPDKDKLRIASESDRTPDSDIASNERTNERTDAADTNGWQSGNDRRRERARDMPGQIHIADLRAAVRHTHPDAQLDNDAGYPQDRLEGLLGERNRRYSGDDQSKTVGELLDDFFATAKRTERQERWPVIRTGPRQPIPNALRLSIYARDDFTCTNRSRPMHDTNHLELDHCIPWSAGGPDDSDNLRTLCSWCNQERSNRVDHAHARVYLPTTWWCVECWTTPSHWRRTWRDGTNPNLVPFVTDDDELHRVYCANCRSHSALSPYPLIGDKGRRLLDQIAPREDRP